MVEKKKKSESASPKAAPKKPRAKKAPAAASAVPQADPSLGSQQAEVLNAAAADPLPPAGIKATAPNTASVPAESDTAAAASMSDADRQALKRELQNEIVELRGLLNKAASGFISPWKIPW